jgi:hypothetical protein
VDCARLGRELPGAARSHVLTCEACAARWEGELSLANGFAGLRSELGGRRSAYIRRTEILQKFDALYPKRSARPWLSLAAAAALLFAIGTGVIVRNQRTHVPAPVFAELSEAQIEMQEAGFIAVPFVPPLAPGELVHMVHTQLHPAALASMGVNVDPMLSSDLPADVLVGADGFPRAVRISDESVIEGGY